MKTLLTAFNLASSGAREGEDAPSRRAQRSLAALGASFLMVSLWGLAAGSTVPAQAAANAYKVPLILLFSVLGALPIALITWKLIGVGKSARELLHGYAASVFLGSSVLVALSPLVALYYHSSNAAGPWVAIVSVFASLAVGIYVFVRNLTRAFEPEGLGWRAVVPSIVLAIAFSATLWQLVSVFEPILPETTVFREGVDALGR
jgi:hypothetical protein